MEFKLYENLKECKDSLLFDNGTIIAELHDDIIKVVIAVAGETCIIDNEEDCHIYSTEDYPEELTQGIVDDVNFVFGNSSRFEATLNNWFEVQVLEKVNDKFWMMTDDNFPYEGELTEETEISIKEYLQQIYNGHIKEF